MSAGEFAAGEPPAWAIRWSLAPADPAAMMQEGWPYLRSLFTVCFSGAQHISCAEVRNLCGTTAALVDAGHFDDLGERVKSALDDTMRRSARGLNPGMSASLLRCGPTQTHSTRDVFV